MTTPAQTTATCDICHQQITTDERYHDDDDEIAHTACVSDWFHRNFGRESLS